MSFTRARCGAFIATVELTSTDDGESMCVACRDRQGLAQRERRVARQLRNLANASAVGGVIALPFAINFVLGGSSSVTAFGSALRSLVLLRAATPHVRSVLGVHHRLALTSAVSGVVTGGIGALILLLNVGLVMHQFATQRH